MTDLKAGVEAMTMGVFERDIGATCLLKIRSDRKPLEYCRYIRATSGNRPASNTDPDGIVNLLSWKQIHANQVSTETMVETSIWAMCAFMYVVQAG